MTMRSDQWLSISLLLALLSNASLLLILTFNTLHSPSDSCGGQPQQPRGCSPNPAETARHRLPDSRTLASDLKAQHKVFSKATRGPSQGPDKNTLRNVDAYPDNVKTRKFLRYKSNDQNSFQDGRVWQAKTEEKAFAYDSIETGDGDLKTQIALLLRLYKQLSKSVNGKHRSRNLSSKARGKFEILLSQEKGTLGKKRKKRDAALLELDAGPDGNYLNYEFQFPKLTENETLQSSNPLSNTLIPGLIRFEERMVRHVEELHFGILSHDLRLERVERAVLNLARGRGLESGRRQRRGDQLLEPVQSDDLKRLAEGYDDFVLVSGNDHGLQGNVSFDELEGESSGESDTNSTVSSSSSSSTTTTTSTTSTTTTTTRPSHPMVYYDLQRDVQEMKHKVLALENYNTMSDSELTRVRSEVTRMDDKVIEMQRVQKNANSVTGQHTYKLNELQMVMNRNSMALTTTMDSYGRLNSRVEEFKDHLTDFEREMHKVTNHFSKHEQISNELRSADSYKAHDIMEIRKAMVNVETRLNEMYNVMDQRIEGVHTNIHSWLERLCFNNDLAC